MEKINKIHKRQLARLLDHLKETGQLTPSLETDLKRSFGFTFIDIHSAIQEPDKEDDNGVSENK